MASHRHANNGLVGRTTSSAADLLKMAEAVATSQKSDFFRDLGPIAVTARASNRIELTVLGGVGNKYKQLVFDVATSADGDATVVRTHISYYRTSQNTVLYFIPAGPKLMSHYATYKLFLERFSATIREADRAAVLRVSDAANTDPVPAAGSSVQG